MEVEDNKLYSIIPSTAFEDDGKGSNLVDSETLPVKSIDNGQVISEEPPKRPVSEWFLLFLCSVCNCMLIGYTYGIAVLFLEMKDTFNTNRAQTSMIQSINTGLMFGGGVLSSMVISMLGVGNCCIVSAIIAGLATSCGYFLDGLPENIITVGAIGGLSLCNIFTSLFIVVGRVFKTNYNLALSCLIMAGGIGSSVFPYLNFYLLETYGWRGTFLILSGILLNCLPLGLSIRIFLPSQPITLQRSSVKIALRDNPVYHSYLSLFQDPVFMTFLLCLVLRSVPIGLVSYFMLDIAEYKDFDAVKGSLFLTIVGFGNLSGRFLIMLTRPCVKCSPVMEYSVYVIISGLSLYILGFSLSFELILVSCGLFGLAYGMISATAGVACFAIAGEKRYPVAVGIFNTAMGIGFGIAGPIGGALRDNVDSYDNILYGFASVSLFAGLMLFIVSCCVSKPEK